MLEGINAVTGSALRLACGASSVGTDSPAAAPAYSTLMSTLAADTVGSLLRDRETRAAALGMDRVDFAMAQTLKTTFKVWSGRERPEFGDGRRGGVPAIIVIDRDCGELQYLNAEGEGAAALGKWEDAGAW